MLMKRCQKCDKLHSITALECECGNKELAFARQVEFADSSENEKDEIWYRICPSCHTENRLHYKDELIVECRNCHDDSVKNGQLLTEQQLQKYRNKGKEKKNSTSAADIQKEREKGISFVHMTNVRDNKIIKIPIGEYMLGRSGEIDSDYFFQFNYIGREHAKIFVTASGVFVEDNDSTNWTEINGRRIVKKNGKCEINTGDQITMADQTFEVEICR